MIRWEGGVDEFWIQQKAKSCPDFRFFWSGQLIFLYIFSENIENYCIKDADVLGRVLIVMIKRDGEVLVPNGNTVILEDDILVVTSNNVKELEKLLNE